MAYKILVTSQKGGVGKSTVSANLAAFFRRRMALETTLIDWDSHGSSSTWLKQAPQVGVVVLHEHLPLDKGGNRPILEARLHLRRAASSSDVVVCDLTWSDAIAAELMFEFDLIIVPTSVSEIEMATTAGFLARHRWVFDSATLRSPTLLLCPTRVTLEQLETDMFSMQRFPVSFMLAPPVLESQTARDLFQRGYLMDARNDCGQSFLEFARAVCEVRDIHNREAALRTSRAPAGPVLGRRNNPMPGAATAVMPSNGAGLLAQASASPQHSVLGQHRQRKALEKEPASLAARSMTALGIPQFLRRMSRTAVDTKP